MKTTTKRFAAFGVTGAAATALIVGGLVLPAQATEQASTATGSTSSSSTDTRVSNALDLATLTQLTNAFRGGDVNTDASGTSVLNGPLVSGDEIGNGTSILNGNSAPIASGNDTSVSAPVTAPVTTDVTAPVETNTTNESNDSSSSNTDINTSVNNLVDDLLGGSGSGSGANGSFGSSSSGGLNLGSIFGR